MDTTIAPDTLIGINGASSRASILAPMSPGASPSFEAGAGRSVSQAVPIDEKVRFLGSPDAYPHRPETVDIVETHMSWVFLAGSRVYKLKKPVRTSSVDFSSLAARRANCLEEVRLNRRLAPDTYRGTIALAYIPGRGLSLGGTGEVVDWLVVMRRLPSDRMLDSLIQADRMSDGKLDRLAAVLADFYARAERPAITPGTYLARHVREQAANRALLTGHRFAIDPDLVDRVLVRLDAVLAASRDELEERAASGHIVDGHGDLRPEHVCLTDPIVIFDCLEFSRELRLVDPFDELAYLGMECSMLGAPRLGPRLIERVATRAQEPVPSRLVRLYTGYRAVLRARLALSHLLDPVPREPQKWEPLTSRYLTLAEAALASTPA